MKSDNWMPWGLGVMAIAVLAVWLLMEPGLRPVLRVPGTDQVPANGDTGPNQSRAGGNIKPIRWAAGQFTRNLGPGSQCGADGISAETLNLARNWDASGPRPVVR